MSLEIAEVALTAEINTGEESGKNKRADNTSLIFDLNPNPETTIPNADNAQFTKKDKTQSCQNSIVE